MDGCLFCGIVAGTTPSKTAYKDEKVTAFWDISPQMPVHILLVPNVHVPPANELTEEHDAVMGHLLRTTQKVAAQEGIAESGFRLVINSGPDAQMSVPHLHIHVLGGRHMGWPPG